MNEEDKAPQTYDIQLPEGQSLVIAEQIVPSIEFYEMEADGNSFTETGRSVKVYKEEWKDRPGTPMSDAIVGFFKELIAQFGYDPKLAALMNHYGIEYHEEDGE